MPDAEAVAKLFHETYERLAPAFGYKTRQDTRVSWESLPEHNKRLMIATAAEVLALLFPLEGEKPSENEPFSVRSTHIEEKQERAET